MDRKINLEPEVLIQMEPMELIDLISSQLDFITLEHIDTDRNKYAAIQEMNKLTAYICYFREMETLARIRKREVKRKKCTREESDRILSVEEILGAYRSICEQRYEQLAKMMTMKRLMLEEIKQFGKTV